MDKKQNNLNFKLDTLDSIKPIMYRIMYLKQTGSIESNSDPLSDNLGGVDKVIEDAVVNSEEGAGPRPLLLQLVGLPGGLGQDPPLGNEHHVLAAELLLELSHKPES